MYRVDRFTCQLFYFLKCTIYKCIFYLVSFCFFSRHPTDALVLFFPTRGTAPGRQCRLKIIVYFVKLLFSHIYVVISIESIGGYHSHHSFIHLPSYYYVWIRFARLVLLFLGTATQVQETLHETAFATSGTEQIPTKETTLFNGGNWCFGR